MKIHRTNNIAMTPERQTNQKKNGSREKKCDSIRDWAIKIESCAPKELSIYLCSTCFVQHCFDKLYE